jgi:hypothetical protein
MIDDSANSFFLCPGKAETQPMQDIFDITVHELGQEGFLGEVRIPKGCDLRFLRPTLTEIWEAPQNVPQLVVEEEPEQHFEAFAIKCPLLSARWDWRLLGLLVFAMDEVIDNALDQLVLVTCHRSTRLATDFAESLETDQTQCRARLNSLCEDSLKPMLFAS